MGGTWYEMSGSRWWAERSAELRRGQCQYLTGCRMGYATNL